MFLPYLSEEILDEELEGQKASRGDFIKAKLGPSWNGLPGYDYIEPFIEKLGEVDPSPKGIYMPWIARLAITRPENNRTEDLDRLHNDLVAFEQFKPKLANKDINSYKSFDDLFAAIEPFLKPRALSKEEKAELANQKRIAELKGQIETVYQGPEGWIRSPQTRAAAQFLGQNTRWCTASHSTKNYFDFYNKEDTMFVVYDKASKKRFQLHIQSGQFANEADKNQGLKAVPQWARQPIVNWYKTHKPDLTFKQLSSLHNFAPEENLAAGHEHEDLINLMKQYGV